jgi:hypothetical protein
MSSIGYLGRFFKTARTARWSTPKKILLKKNLKKKSLIKNHKWIKSSSKIYIYYFFGALGQALHQAVSKKRPKSPKLDIPFLIFFRKRHIIEKWTQSTVYLSIIILCFFQKEPPGQRNELWVVVVVIFSPTNNNRVTANNLPQVWDLT